MRGSFDINTTAYIPLQFFFFIPIGILTPIILNKGIRLKNNLITFVAFTISIQLIKLILSKGVANIDYAIIGISGCLVGFAIYSLLYRIKLSSKLS